MTIMSSTASHSAKAISIFTAQDLFYNVKHNAAIGIFTYASPFAFCPQLMPTVQLFDALHRGQAMVMQKKHLRFFWAVFIAVFVWEWFPEYIAPFVSSHYASADYATYANYLVLSPVSVSYQKSAWFTCIFGGTAGNEGLGMSSPCFDWAYVESGGGTLGALFIPLSLYSGCAACIIAFCAIYVTNTWKLARPELALPQSTAFSTRTVTKYDQLGILNDDYTLNEEKLAQEGLPWYAASQLLYKISRMMYIGGLSDFPVTTRPDQGMRRPSLPQDEGLQGSSTLGGTLPSLLLAPPSASVAHTVLVPVYPCGLLSSLSSSHGSPSLSLELFGSQNNMYFTVYGYNPVVQALALMTDLKMMIGTITILGGLLNFVIMRSIIDGQRDLLLQVQGSNVWSGQQVQSYNSAAIAWGAPGKPLYAPGTPYPIRSLLNTQTQLVLT
ncbi:oligopeptide transporter [Moniliophthora roreri]|nr:oligopeptide transporter [Moniliophthora roreri]